MIRKLLSLYQNSIIYQNQPENPSNLFYYFCSEEEDVCIGIPKKEVSDKELNLLNALYKLVEHQPSSLSPAATEWYNYLFHNTPPPNYYDESYLRFIQFRINGVGANQTEIESALKGFFTDDVLIIWESQSKGIVIEEKKRVTLSEEELISMKEILESDFYVKISLFVGKFIYFTDQLREKFIQEKEYFLFALNQLGSSSIYTSERVFPSYLACHLPEELKNKTVQEIIGIFNEDMDMFSTIKVFLENNLNASMTAKKLYIHRNTLQYRIDKFIEKTGIGLKDFYGAFTVFLACLLFEHQHKK